MLFPGTLGLMLPMDVLSSAKFILPRMMPLACLYVSINGALNGGRCPATAHDLFEHVVLHSEVYNSCSGRQCQNTGLLICVTQRRTQKELGGLQ